MKRKIFSLIIVIFLISMLVLHVYATEAAMPKDTIYAAYWQDGVLYTFAQLGQNESDDQSVSLLVNNQLFSEAEPEKLADMNEAIHYMLLVDTSSSMVWNRTSILSFAQNLIEAQQNIKISIAKFDREFEVIDSDLSTWDAVKASLRSLTFNKDGSDINGSVAAAIEYLGSNGYVPGELTNLVLITDGEPWYTNNKNREKEFEREANHKLSALMEAYPEIMVHTFSFTEWDDDTYAPYSASNGMHFVEQSAKEAAKELSSFIDEIYSVRFPINGYDKYSLIHDDMILCIGRNLISYKNIRNASVLPELNIDVSQEEIPEESSVPEEPADPEITEPAYPEMPEGGGENVSENVAEAETSSAAENTEIAEIETADVEEKGVSKTENSTKMLYIICGVVALLLLTVLTIIVVKKKQIRKKSVRMKIEKVSGGKIRVKDMYYLSDMILIGSGKKCDVIVPGTKGVECARIIKRDQMIYIEDMGAEEGVLLNGMRIFSPNRLRSGDEITVETTTLKVLF